MPAEDTSVDHYAALQVSSTAQSSEIKTSYRKLALLYHPDRNHGNEAEANRKFQAIQAAYEVLTDANRRAKYDRARLAAGYGVTQPTAATTANTTKNGFTTPSTTAARTHSTTAATSNTAKRYTSAAGYASSMKPETRTDYKAWASGSYASRGAFYRDTDKEKSRSSDDDKKRREQRERERSSKTHSSSSSSRAKQDYPRSGSPNTPSTRRPKEAEHVSAYAHTFRSEHRRSSRGRSPDPSSGRATSGLGGESDPDPPSRSSRPYSYKPEASERFTTLRPNSPIPEGRRSDGARYRSYEEPPGTYFATPERGGAGGGGGERYGRHASYAQPSRKSRKSEEFDKQHVPPPSPPPDRTRDRSKYPYTYHETSDEDSTSRSRRKTNTARSTRKGGSQNWGPAYVESEDDSDDGAKGDDEKASEDRTFEEKMAGMNFGQTADEKVKNGWEGLKEPRPRSPTRASMAPETPRRTPSPYGKSPGKNDHSPSNKKKGPTRSTSPSHSHIPPPSNTVPAPGVFAFQIPPATTEASQPAFQWQNAFPPSHSMPPPRPQFAQYQTPIYAPAPSFTPAPPPQPSHYPFMRPASTQPMSHKNFPQAPGLSDSDLKAVFENLTPGGGLPTKKSEPNLKGRRPRSKGAKPKITTKFSELSISGSSSPVKDNASDGSRSIFGDTSSQENLKQKKEKQTEAAAAHNSSGPMDIDPPPPPTPLSAQPPLSARLDPNINGRSTSAADVPLPASPMNGFHKPSATPAPSRPDPLSTFHNLANLYPINTAENLGGLNAMANLKDALPFKSQASSTVNLDGKSREEAANPTQQANSFPPPPKPPTLPLPIRLDANGKLDSVTYKPYWEAMQVYVDQWRDYEAKMLALLQMKLETNSVDFKDILTDPKAARQYNSKAKEEKAIRDEWTAQKSKFMMVIIECHQLRTMGETTTPPVVQTNTSFLGNYVKSKFPRMPTFSGVPGANEPSTEGTAASQQTTNS